MCIFKYENLVTCQQHVMCRRDYLLEELCCGIRLAEMAKFEGIEFFHILTFIFQNFDTSHLPPHLLHTLRHPFYPHRHVHHQSFDRTAVVAADIVYTKTQRHNTKLLLDSHCFRRRLETLVTQIYSDRLVERTACRFWWNPMSSCNKIIKKKKKEKWILSFPGFGMVDKSNFTCSVRSPLGQSLRKPLCHWRISFSVTVREKKWKKKKENIIY